MHHSKPSAKQSGLSENPKLHRLPHVLSIAGSDSGGGAGIQADIKTLSALGCYASTAITALTAQNTLGVQGVSPVPPEFLAEQINSVLSDIGADCVKVGMFGSLKHLDVIKERLIFFGVKSLVFDPVIISTSQNWLVAEISKERFKANDHDQNSHATSELLSELKQKLISLMRLSTLFTPNLKEAEFILERPINYLSDMKGAAQALIDLGANAVLLKGGHLVDENHQDSTSVVDLLIGENLNAEIFESKRIQTKNLHGTGCTLSSAVAAYLAKGLDLPEAVRFGREYLIGAMTAGVDFEYPGNGPLNHLFKQSE